MKKITLLFTIVLLGFSTAFGQWPATGSPDLYGYNFETFNNTDARYQWVDITATGTEVFGLADDNFVGPFDLGFDFDYYWFKHNNFYIGSNGYISFNKGFNIASTAIGFPPTPTADDNNDLIAALMCDLSFFGAGNTGRCFYYTNRVDSLVVSFIDVPFWNNNTAGYDGSNTFQIILNQADSTIKLLYADQQGRWNPGYDGSPNPMVIGIENITGNIGIMVDNMSLPEPANTGVTQAGVVFKAPAVSSFDVFDVAPIDVQNPQSGGFFLPVPGGDFPINTTVGNVGNRDLVLETTVTAEARDTIGQLLYLSTFKIDSMNKGDLVTETFGVPFNPPLPGPFSLTVSVQNDDDINATNDSRTLEAVAVDTTGGKAALQYVSDNRQNISQFVQWAGGSGNSGVGIYFEPTGYPAKIEAVEFFVFPNADNTDTLADGGYRFVIHDDEGAIPGAPLYQQTVEKADVDIAENTPGGLFLGAWNRVTLPVPIEILDGGFYVAWYHLNDSLALVGETAAPISRRTFEILDGTWAPHRSGATEDYYIRPILDVRGVTRGVGIEDIVSDVNSFEVYPNPTTGQVTLDVNLNRATDVSVKIFDLQGRKVYVNFGHMVSKFSETADLSQMAKGVYIVQVATRNGMETKKIVLK